MAIEVGKHLGTIESHGVRENTRLPEAPLEAFASFMVNGEKVYWNGLLLTRAGERNTKTMKCLAAMGLENEDVVGWLNKNIQGQDVQLTFKETTTKSGETRVVVDWVNALGGSTGADQGVLEKLKAAGLGGDEVLPFSF